MGILLYFVIFILLIGLIGNILNMIVLSRITELRRTLIFTYLTGASVTNIGYLISHIFVDSIVKTYRFAIFMNAWACKFYICTAQFFQLVPLIITCLAIINQCVQMSHLQLSSTQLACRQLCIVLLFATIHGIFFIFSFDSSEGSCSLISSAFGNYLLWFYYPFVVSFLPIIIMLASTVIKCFQLKVKVSHRSHSHRIRTQRQLTMMIIVQTIITIISLVPNFVYSLFDLNSRRFVQIPSIHHEKTLLIPRLWYSLSCIVCFYGREQRHKLNSSLFFL